MKIKTIAFILFVLPFFAFTAVHKYYVSVTQIDYVKEKKEVQITSRIFIDDFEKLIKERYDETIVLGEEKEGSKVDMYIEKYLKSKLIITINDESKELKFIGKEYEDDIIYCYFQIEKVRKIKSFEVSNETLFDKFDEQKNIVRTFINSRHKTFVLIPENHKGMLKF